MKLIKTMAAAVLVLGAGNAWAFHSGGVAECEGCHSMHNSLEGQAMSVSGGALGPYLLIGQDQSSTCLDCHSGNRDRPNSYHVSSTWDATNILTTINFTPGGDFSWLKKTYTYTPRAGTIETSLGERHGHSIVAKDFSFDVDGAQSVAPGGIDSHYPASALACSSCHDPHGKYRSNTDGTFATTGKPIYGSGSYGDLPTSWGAVGTYRLLAGVGYQPKSLSGSFAFTQPPISAIAPRNYNMPETAGPDQVLVVYGRSSGFCANCHPNMHTNFVVNGTVHPADQTLGTDVANVYKSYKKSGDVTGNGTSSYTTLVPFQRDNTTLVASLKNFVDKVDGPLSSDRVACLTCHRAHASGFDSMTRWGLGNEFMTVADGAGVPIWPSIASNPAQAQGRTEAEQQAAYYGRPATQFAPYQRVYCNKCHAKD
jgi:hypothetical protein